MVALLVLMLFELRDNESTAVFMFAWDKCELFVVLGFELFVAAPFAVPSVEVEFEPFTRLVWEEDVASFLAKLVVLTEVDAGALELLWTDVVDALTAAEAVATPARVAAAEAGGAPVVVEAFVKMLFEVKRGSFSLASACGFVVAEVALTFW